MHKIKVKKKPKPKPSPCGYHLLACPGSTGEGVGVGITDGLENPIREILSSLSAAL